MKTFFLAACMATIGTGALAHSGGLNASGCHNNRKTGDYHCHRAAAPAPFIRQQNNNRPQTLFGNGGGAFRNCSEARAAGRHRSTEVTPDMGLTLTETTTEWAANKAVALPALNRA